MLASGANVYQMNEGTLEEGVAAAVYSYFLGARILGTGTLRGTPVITDQFPCIDPTLPYTYSGTAMCSVLVG